MAEPNPTVTCPDTVTPPAVAPGDARDQLADAQAAALAARILARLATHTTRNARNAATRGGAR